MNHFNEFQQKVEELDKEIKAYYENKGEKISEDGEEYQKKILFDGIVNIEEYYKSPIKIMWILKEPYDEENEGEGGWPLSEYLGSDKFFEKHKAKRSKTYYPIIYTTYAILNKEINCYDDMDFISNEPEMIRCLRKIAYINIQKFPKGKKSNDSEISKAYQEHKKDILLKQIKVYNPDIIIGGSTMWNFVNDLKLGNNKCDGGLDYWINEKEGKIYIDAYHPSQRTTKEAVYVDSILDIFNSCKTYLKTN